MPLCRGHHREVHRCGDEAKWWLDAGIDPMVQARALWLKTRPLPTAPDNAATDVAGPASSVADNQRSTKRDRVARARKRASAVSETKPILPARPQ